MLRDPEFSLVPKGISSFIPLPILLGELVYLSDRIAQRKDNRIESSLIECPFIGNVSLKWLSIIHLSSNDYSSLESETGPMRKEPT